MSVTNVLLKTQTNTVLGGSEYESIGGQGLLGKVHYTLPARTTGKFYQVNYSTDNDVNEIQIQTFQETGSFTPAEFHSLPAALIVGSTTVQIILREKDVFYSKYFRCSC